MKDKCWTTINMNSQVNPIIILACSVTHKFDFLFNFDLTIQFLWIMVKGPMTAPLDPQPTSSYCLNWVHTQFNGSIYLNGCPTAGPISIIGSPLLWSLGWIKKWAPTCVPEHRPCLAEGCPHWTFGSLSVKHMLWNLEAIVYSGWCSGTKSGWCVSPCGAQPSAHARDWVKFILEER